MDAWGMADYTKLNLRDDVEDMAPKFGYAPDLEARYARKPLGLANSGASYFRIAPDFRLPFGHKHGEQEELYVVLSGSVRIKAGDDIVELGELVREREGTPRQQRQRTGPPCPFVQLRRRWHHVRQLGRRSCRRGATHGIPDAVLDEARILPVRPDEGCRQQLVARPGCHRCAAEDVERPDTVVRCAQAGKEVAEHRSDRR